MSKQQPHTVKAMGQLSGNMLGVDVGGTKIAAALVDEAGSLRSRLRETVDQSSGRSALVQLKRIIQGFEHPELKGIGVCIPGIADRKQRTVWAPNIRGWDNIFLEKELQEAVRSPLTVESDRNAAVLGEAIFGTAQGKKDVVFLILGTGIGAGILSGGRLIRGAHDIAGAVGWVPVPREDVLQRFEDVASGPGIESMVERRTGIRLSLEELAARAPRDTGLMRVFKEAGRAVGVVMAGLVSIFNPELIVVGGGVSNVWHLMEDSARDALDHWSQPIALTQVEIQVSCLGEDAGILGAAAVARYHGEIDLR